MMWKCTGMVRAASGVNCRLDAYWAIAASMASRSSCGTKRAPHLPPVSSAALGFEPSSTPGSTSPPHPALATDVATSKPRNAPEYLRLLILASVQDIFPDGRISPYLVSTGQRYEFGHNVAQVRLCTALWELVPLP